VLCSACAPPGRKVEGETWINLKDRAWEATIIEDRAVAALWCWRRASVTGSAQIVPG
jgi:hypothetical protein